MKNKYLLISIFIGCFSFLSAADWTILVYMQGDNNLNDFLQMDVSNEMEAANLSSRVNLLVQMDKANHHGTLRYKIENHQAVLVQTLTHEMGTEQVQELVDGMKWAATYPAQHYALILSGHGSGIIDPVFRKEKGILFDDSEGTYLSNQGLASAVNQIKTS